MKLTKLAAFAVVGMLSPAAFAASDADESAALLKRSQMTLTQAIAVAEKHVSGQAVSADLDDKKGAAVYDVEVLASGRLYDVHINAADGSVTKVKEDID